MTPIQVRHSYDRSKRAGTKRILYRNRVFSLSHQMAQDATFLYALQSSSAGHGSGQTIFFSPVFFYQQVAGRISKRNYIPLVGPCAKFQKCGLLEQRRKPLYRVNQTAPYKEMQCSHSQKGKGRRYQFRASCFFAKHLQNIKLSGPGKCRLMWQYFSGDQR